MMKKQLSERESVEEFLMDSLEEEEILIAEEAKEDRLEAEIEAGLDW